MHLYLHVPFCARRCSYCDFAIAVRRTVPSAAYVERVLQEWDTWQDHPAWHASPALDTIYLGGGTPSLLEPGAIATLLDRLRRDRPLAAGAEVTLEANPDDVSPASARAWRAAGLTRVSLGVQSFDPGVLAWMHRTHTVAQVPGAVAALRDAGFENLSLDLIYALPRSLERDWEGDLSAALALEPEHLSLYGLTVEPHTPLGRWVDRGVATPPPDERYAGEFLAAHGRLTGAGYEHYEVSNYARPGHRAVHNSAYWRRAPYLGLGPSAHSGLGTLRRWNLREWAAYDRALAEGRSAGEGEESLTPAAEALENLYLGLRTADGLPLGTLPAARVRAWEEAGWAVSAGGRLRLTAEGWLRLDALVAAAAGI